MNRCFFSSIYLYCPLYIYKLNQNYINRIDPLSENPSETYYAMRGKHKNKKSSDSLLDVFKLIKCINPSVYVYLEKCGLTFEEAKKYVKKLIDQTVECDDYSCCHCQGIPYFMEYQHMSWWR